MPANTTPIFPITPKASWGKVTAANTATDGTGTTVLVYTAGANGSRIDQIKARALGTNVATVLRLFVNNGSDPATAANNSLIHEKTIAATTLSQTAELVDNLITISVNSTETVPPIQALPAGYRIYASVGTAIAAGLQVTVSGGDY